MQSRFKQFGVKKRKLEKDELVAEELMEQSRVPAVDEPEERKPKPGEKKSKFEEDSEQREMNAIFLLTQKEEEERMAEIYPNLKRVLADPRYVAKSAVKMFRTRTNISDEEFEEILELCNVRRSSFF